MDIVRLKAVIVGAGAVGKTALYQVLLGRPFPREYIPTVFSVEPPLVLPLDADRKGYFSVWDTAGQADYDRLRPLSYPGTNVFVLVYSIADRGSYDLVLEKFKPELQKELPHAPIILVANKSDLRSSEGIESSLFVTPAEGEEMRNRIGALCFLEVSALTNVGLDNLRDRMAEACSFIEPPREKNKCTLQ